MFAKMSIKTKVKCGFIVHFYFMNSTDLTTNIPQINRLSTQEDFLISIYLLSGEKSAVFLRLGRINLYSAI